MKKIDSLRKVMQMRLVELEDMRKYAKTYGSFDIIEARMCEVRRVIDWADEISGIKVEKKK